MKVKYDQETDILYISFNENKVAESDQDRQGIILDYDAEGKIVGIEVLDASSQMAQPDRVDYEAA